MADVFNFNCIADTYVSSEFPSNNYGAIQVLRIGAGTKMAAIYGFDISSLPKNKVIAGVTLKFYLVSLANSSFTLADEDYSANPSIIKARRIKTVELSEIETTLNYSQLSNKPDADNIFGVQNNPGDASIGILYLRRSVVSIPVYDITRDENGKFVVALFADFNFSNNWLTKNIFANAYSKEQYMPQLSITTNDYVPPKPNNLVPNNSARNKAGEIKLSWQWEDPYMGTTQATYEAVYSTDNFATSTTASGTVNNYHVISANVFTAGQTVKWKVRITDTNGDTSGWSDIGSFIIGETIPSVPEPLSPINTIVNSSDEINFRWKFKDLYGYSQAKYDLQYRKGTDPETTVTVESGIPIYIMPMAILQGGDHSWRVRTYNQFEEVSEYSEWKPFYSIGRPDNPVISSVSNNMHPMIKWTADEQDMYIIKIYKGSILVYDSGELASGSVNEHTVTEYLDNGSYILSLRISNVYGFWSNETQYAFTMSTEKPDKPSLIGSSNDAFIALLISSNTVDNVIYRKGEKDTDYKSVSSIAQMNTFNDYSAPAGSNMYFVRSITEDAFADSDIITVDMSFRGIILAGAEKQDDYINLYQTKDSDKRKSIFPQKDQYLVNCNGRRYPLKQGTEFRNHSENHEYFIKPDEYDKLYRILDYDELIYRNNYGYYFKVSVSNPNIQEDTFGYNATFTLTRLEE